MAEFEVKPGRVLVGANMGERYERHNDPEAAFSFLKRQRERLYTEFLGQMKKIRRGVLEVHPIGPTTPEGITPSQLVVSRELGEAQSKILTLREMLATAEWEIAFLEGRDMTGIDSQFKIQYPIW